MAKAGITWVKPPEILAVAVERYGQRLWTRLAAELQHFASTELEPAAKESAPWTDRTGNARSGLFATSEVNAAARVATVFLNHGLIVDYGVYLELAHGAKHAVIMPTILAKSEIVMERLRRLLL